MPDPIKMETLTMPDGAVYDICDDEAIRFTEQTLTEEQKRQARANIGVTDEADDGGVWVGSEAPPDDSYKVWIDPAGSSSGSGGSGSGGILDAYVEGETLVFTESSTVTIENETLIL